MVHVRDFPSIDAHVGFGQELPLNTCRQGEVVFERALLPRGQVVDTEPDEGIGDESIDLDRVVTDLAKTVGPTVHPCKRCVHLHQQSGDIAGRCLARNSAFQPAAAIHQLIAKRRFSSDLHRQGFSP